MDADLRRRALLWAGRREHLRRVERARQIIGEALRMAPSWYVAFSTGKDSSVVLAMVREQAPDTVAHHSLHQWMLPESEALLAETPNTRLVAYQDYDETDWAQRWKSQGAALARGARWLASDEIATRGAPEAGVFLGLRAEESAARRAHLRSLGVCYHNRTTGVWQCNPIAWWSTLDVWAYIASHELPYNRAYDRLAEIGVPLERQRIGPLAQGRALGYGQLAILKRGWPGLFNRYAAAHPEARGYV